MNAQRVSYFGIQVSPGVYIPFGGPETLLKTGVEIGKNAESTAFSISLMHLF